MARSYGFKRNVAVVAFVMLGLVLLSVIVMIAVGVAVAIPYGKTKHFSETTASCTVVRVNRSGMISCSTTNDMDNTQTSKYPCLIISVNYTDLETGEIITNSPLYAGPYNYESLKEDGCSVFSCVTDKDDNAEKVAEFERKYGNIGQTFPCHPGSRADPEALLSVIPLWHVLLGLLLPSSVFFVALTFFVLYCICCVM